MPSRYRMPLLVAGIFLLGLFCVGAIWWISPSKEPAYAGRDLTIWLTELKTNPAEATKAVQTIGSNGVPTLVSILGHKEPWILDAIRQKTGRKNFPWAPKAPWPLKLKALDAIKILGPVAESAIPDLATLALSKDPYVAMGAVGALEFLGEDAIAPLAHAVIKAPNKEARNMSSMILGRMKPGAKAAVPALISALSDQYSAVRQDAAWAIGEIGEHPEWAVPSLIQCLNDPVPEVQRNAIHALGRFTTDARAAIPHLRQVLNRSDTNAANSAKSALLRIDPAGSKDLLVYCELCKTNQSFVNLHKPIIEAGFALQRLCQDCFKEKIMTPRS